MNRIDLQEFRGRVEIFGGTNLREANNPEGQDAKPLPSNIVHRRENLRWVFSDTPIHGVGKLADK